MNVLRSIIGCTLTASVAFCATIGLNQRVAAEQPPAPAAKGIEVQTRGPVHEAFAETITFDPQPGIVVPKTPPAAIEEVPPPQRPEGKNMAWIPGYWAWDDERNDFLWLSGIWRALPPGRQWVPGYWGQSQQGAQWTSGYWADASGHRRSVLARAAGDGRGRSQHCRTSRPTISGCQAAGFGSRTATPGAPVTGRQEIKTGIGCRTITCGPPAATSSSMATTTTRFRVAASCLRRSILMAVSALSAVSPTRLRR